MRKNVSIADKITKMLELEEHIPLSLEELTPGAKTWYLCTMKPLLLCLKHHYQGNLPAFLLKYPLKTGISSFKKTCCSGSNDIYSI